MKKINLHPLDTKTLFSRGYLLIVGCLFVLSCQESKPSVISSCGLLTINLIKMEIEKQIDELTHERWRFSFINRNIYLESYYVLQKESKMHRNYQILKKYERLSKRDSNIEESEVPFTDELKAEALNQFVSTIKVLKWSER